MSRRLVAAVVLAALLLVTAVVIRNHDTSRFEQRICDRVDRLDNVFIAVLERNPPKHPTVVQLREYDRLLGDLRAAVC